MNTIYFLIFVCCNLGIKIAIFLDLSGEWFES